MSWFDPTAAPMRVGINYAVGNVESRMANSVPATQLDPTMLAHRKETLI